VRRAAVERPELDFDLMIYWDAFFEISLGRAHGEGGPQSLGVVDILMYLSHKNVYSREEREEYLFFIRKLDNEYLKIAREQRAERDKRRNAKNEAKTRQPRRRT
jgi:hypothetical protein